MSTQSLKTASPMKQWGSLVHAEFTLLQRNAAQLAYSIIFPLLCPFIFVPLADQPHMRGSLGVLVTLILVTGLLGVSFYVPLSAVVNRREDQVLTRLRAGEVGDNTILAAVATPSFTLGLIMSAGMLAVSARVLDFGLPENLALLTAALLVTIVLFIFAGLATSIITRTAESAQISSLPVLMLLLLGPSVPLFAHMLPEVLADILRVIPTAATAELISIAWSDSQVSPAPQLIVLGVWIAVLAGLVKTKFRWSRRS